MIGPDAFLFTFFRFFADMYLLPPYWLCRNVYSLVVVVFRELYSIFFLGDYQYSSHLSVVMGNINSLFLFWRRDFSRLLLLRGKNLCFLRFFSYDSFFFCVIFLLTRACHSELLDTFSFAFNVLFVLDKGIV